MLFKTDWLDATIYQNLPNNAAQASDDKLRFISRLQDSLATPLGRDAEHIPDVLLTAICRTLIMETQPDGRDTDLRALIPEFIYDVLTAAPHRGIIIRRTATHTLSSIENETPVAGHQRMGAYNILALCGVSSDICANYALPHLLRGLTDPFPKARDEAIDSLHYVLLEHGHLADSEKLGIVLGQFLVTGNSETAKDALMATTVAILDGLKDHDRLNQNDCLNLSKTAKAIRQIYPKESGRLKELLVEYKHYADPERSRSLPRASGSEYRFQ